MLCCEKVFIVIVALSVLSVTMYQSSKTLQIVNKHYYKEVGIYKRKKENNQDKKERKHVVDQEKK